MNKGTVSLILSHCIRFGKAKNRNEVWKRGQDGRMSLDRSNIFHTNDYTTICCYIISMQYGISGLVSIFYGDRNIS